MKHWQTLIAPSRVSEILFEPSPLWILCIFEGLEIQEPYVGMEFDSEVAARKFYVSFWGMVCELCM